MGPQWEWNFQPRKDKWSLTEKRGWLRLHAFKPLEQNNLLKAGNTLTQRTFRTSTNEVIIKLDISGMADGEHTGLSHFGSPNYSAIGVACEGTSKYLEFNVKGIIAKGVMLLGNDLWLRSTWGLDGKSQYYYSVDGKSFIAFDSIYQMMWGAYRGDRIAMYNYNNKAAEGYVDIDYFHYAF